MATRSISTAAERSVRVWDLPLRIFHWLLVALIALAFLSSEEGNPLSEWHLVTGWTVTVLIVFRIAWRFVGGEHSRWADFLKPSGLPQHVGELLRLTARPTLGHNPLGAASGLAALANSVKRPMAYDR